MVPEHFSGKFYGHKHKIASGQTGIFLCRKETQASVLGLGWTGSFLSGTVSSGKCIGSPVGQEIFTEEGSSDLKGYRTGSQGWPGDQAGNFYSHKHKIAYMLMQEGLLLCLLA